MLAVERFELPVERVEVLAVERVAVPVERVDLPIERPTEVLALLPFVVIVVERVDVPVERFTEVPADLVEVPALREDTVFALPKVRLLLLAERSAVPTLRELFILP